MNSERSQFYFTFSRGGELKRCFKKCSVKDVTRTDACPEIVNVLFSDVTIRQKNTNGDFTPKVKDGSIT
jgi:hypothetical protein